jgi:arylsulfatase A-like enzyme
VGAETAARRAGHAGAAAAWVGSWLACLGIALLLFSAARLVFWSANQARLPALPLAEAARAFAGGVRFDVSALVWLNSAFLLSHLLPHPWRDHPRYRLAQKRLFLAVNGAALTLELVDAAYYPFALRRSGPGDLAMATTVVSLWPRLVAEFFWVPLLAVALVYAAGRLYDLAARGFAARPGVPLQLAVAAISLGLAVVGTRGGTQLRPLSPNAAAQYVGDPRLVPLVANTTLHWIFAVDQHRLTDPGYLGEAEREALAPLRRDPSGRAPRGRNAVVIVMESLGRADVGFFAPDPVGASLTPFLDSLLGEGMTFSQTFANALRSAEGVPAIAAGLPALMPDPWIFSAHQTNLVDGPARLLAARGYQTLFFHGGNPGTMAFDRLAPSVGFARYADRRDFADDRHYDGAWGIYDVPFFEWTARQLAGAHAPFLALLVSVSSHHPYRVEPDFEARHPDLAPRARSVRYADDALRRFFTRAREAPWYRDTLFVVTGDHTARRERERDRVSVFEVPIVLVAGDGSLRGEVPGIMQQIDITPTLLDWLGYPEPYFAFGRSAFDTDAPRDAFMLLDGLYQILDGERLLLHDGERPIGLYDPGGDPGMRRDLRADEPARARRLARRLEAVIQTHHRAMLANSLSIDARARSLDQP